jgi:hypothetical protein
MAVKRVDSICGMVPCECVRANVGCVCGANMV